MPHVSGFRDILTFFSADPPTLSGWMIRIKAEKLMTGSIRVECFPQFESFSSSLQTPGGLSGVFYRGQASIRTLCHKVQMVDLLDLPVGVTAGFWDILY